MLRFWGLNQNSWLEGSKQNYWSFNVFLRKNVNYGDWSIIFKNCITKCDETILVCVCPVSTIGWPAFWRESLLTSGCSVHCSGHQGLPSSATGRQSSGNSPPWTLDPGQWAAAPLWIYRHLQKRQGSSITIKLPNPLLHMSPEFMLLK